MSPHAESLLPNILIDEDNPGIAATVCEHLVAEGYHWADQRYMAERHGVRLPDQWPWRGNGVWMADYLGAQLANREQRLGLTGVDEAGLDFDYNSLIRHGKGATGVYLQAERIGSNAFLELERRLLADYRYRELPEQEFVARLEAAGAAGAGAFFAAWRRGDARLGFDVLSHDDSLVVVGRTGTVPYPLAFEVILPADARNAGPWRGRGRWTPCAWSAVEAPRSYSTPKACSRCGTEGTRESRACTSRRSTRRT
jgi:hypothetical protein